MLVSEREKGGVKRWRGGFFGSALQAPTKSHIYISKSLQFRSKGNMTV